MVLTRRCVVQTRHETRLLAIALRTGSNITMLRYFLPLLAVAFFWAGPARAELKVCNQSFDVLNLAFGQPIELGFRTEGWWRVAPNQCATLIRGALSARYFYVFATDVFGKSVLPGTVPMCVSPRRFRIDGEQDCLLRGHIEARFVQVDTGRADDWTVFVAPQP